MSQESQAIPPPIIWAQRADILYVTICLEDCNDPKIEIEPEKIYFKGIGGTDRKMHELTINLYKPVKPEMTLKHPKERMYELVLRKKEEGPYWPRLTKEDTKFHWLKIDFNKWREENESEDESESGPTALASSSDYAQVMREMGYMGGAGDTKPDFDDDLDGLFDKADSDDDELPDLE